MSFKIVYLAITDVVFTEKQLFLSFTFTTIFLKIKDTMKMLKPQGLFKKLLYYQFVMVFVIITCLFFTISFVEKRFWNNYLLKEAKQNLRFLNPQIMRIFGREFGKSSGSLNIARTEIAEILKEREGVVNIFIIDNEGRILFSFKDDALPPFGFQTTKLSTECFIKKLFCAIKDI